MKARAGLALALCLAALGCSEDETHQPPANHAPALDSLRIAPAAILPADTVHVRAYGSDADGDTLSYAFAATAGGLLSQSAGDLTWLAPGGAQACTLTVEVSDGRASDVRDTALVVHDTAPLSLAFERLFAESGTDTLRAGAAADTFPLGWTFHAEWSADSAAAIRRIRYEWRGVQGELPDTARSFEAAIGFSGYAQLTLRAAGEFGETGRPISYLFVGNFSPTISFLRDAEGRRIFSAQGIVHAEGDTLPSRREGYDIAACVAASDPDGRVSGYQYRHTPHGAPGWSPAALDSCVELRGVSDGDHALFARAVDGAERTGEPDALRFFVNRAPRFVQEDAPSGFMQRPRPGDTLTVAEGEHLDIRFWAPDPDGELAWYRYRLDAHPWSSPLDPSPGAAPGLPAGSLSDEIPFPVAPGAHRIEVAVADEGGRRTAIEVPFVLVLAGDRSTAGHEDR